MIHCLSEACLFEASTHFLKFGLAPLRNAPWSIQFSIDHDCNTSQVPTSLSFVYIIYMYLRYLWSLYHTPFINYLFIIKFSIDHDCNTSQVNLSLLRVGEKTGWTGRRPADALLNLAQFIVQTVKRIGVYFELTCPAPSSADYMAFRLRPGSTIINMMS